MPNGTNFHSYFTPLFSFAIESYLYETDFTLGLSQKYHLIPPPLLCSRLSHLADQREADGRKGGL